jgi:hypothetical protein
MSDFGARAGYPSPRTCVRELPGASRLEPARATARQPPACAVTVDQRGRGLPDLARDAPGRPSPSRRSPRGAASRPRGAPVRVRDERGPRAASARSAERDRAGSSDLIASARSVRRRAARARRSHPSFPGRGTRCAAAPRQRHRAPASAATDAMGESAMPERRRADDLDAPGSAAPASAAGAVAAPHGRHEPLRSAHAAAAAFSRVGTPGTEPPRRGGAVLEPRWQALPRGGRRKSQPSSHEPAPRRATTALRLQKARTP